MNSELYEKGKIIITTLEAAGYEIYPVGGCVRDFLLGTKYQDIDFATNASTTVLLKLFCKYTTIDIGAKFGTIGVVIDETLFEITTFRTDGDYYDNRHPSSVKFASDLREDLSRRDFTINAMAYNNGEIIDLFGGVSDLEHKIIRTVGNPSIRFNEDALRIMRALRFSATLDFEIEENTAFSLRENAHLLSEVSAERIRSEFAKILCAKAFMRVFTEFFDVFCVFMPEIAYMQNFSQNTKYHIYDVALHTAHVVAKSPYRLPLKLAAFLHDVGKPFCYTEDINGVGHFKGHAKKSVELARKILTRLRFDKKTINDVLLLIEFHDTKILPNKPCVKRMLNQLSPRLFFDLLELKCADLAGKNPIYFGHVSKINEVHALAQNIIQSGECYSLSTLSVNGDDFKCMGFAGEDIGKLLSLSLNLVIDGKLINEKKIILAKIHDFF